MNERPPEPDGPGGAGAGADPVPSEREGPPPAPGDPSPADLSPADLSPEQQPPVSPAPRSPARPPPLPSVRAAGPDGRGAAVGALTGSRAPDTYVPVLPGRKPRWWALLLGLPLSILGFWLLIGILPDIERKFEAAVAEGAVEHDDNPFRARSRIKYRSFWDDDINEPQYDVDGVMMSKSELEVMQVGAWFLLVSGLSVTLLLGTRRPGRIRFCDVCGRDVLVVPRKGWRCERCNTKV